MTVIIPTRSLPAFNFEMALEGVPYRFSFEWNSRREFWTMNIFTRTDVPLIVGIKLILNYELIRRYRRNLPPGAIVAIDITGRLQRIGREDLGENVRLIYIPRDELDGTI